jgi:hypothetical protein
MIAGNRKGTVMVEAALVMPLALLVVITLLVMCVFLYQEVHQSSNLYQNLLEESCYESQTGTTGYNISNDFIFLKKSRLRQFPQIHGETSISYDSRGWVSLHSQNKFEANRYIIKEMDYIRWIDSLKSVE